MATEEVIRQSEFLNQLVLDRNTMEELGRVEVLWMYPQAHRVLGFICKTGLLGNQKLAFQLAQVEAFGESGVITHSQPQKTDAEKVRRLESLLDHEVWSNEGNRLGKITDCLFNLKTGKIDYYLLTSTGWFGIIGEVYQLSPNQILSFGKKRVLMSEAAAANLEIYQPGISQKITQVGERLREEAVQEWSSIAQQAETKTEQAKEQLQQLTEQAKVRAQRFSVQFRQKAQIFSEQVKEKTQSLIEQAKEKSQTLAEQVEESIETLTVQAEEIFDRTPEASRQSTSQATSAATKSTSAGLVDDELNEFDEFDELDELDELDEDWWIDEPPSKTAADSPATTNRTNPTAANPTTTNPVANQNPVVNQDDDDDEPWI